MKARKERRQYGALPYRETGTGGVEVLLVTSRETGRWIIPKGWPMRGRRPHKAAAVEAFEEAGVTGRSSKKAVGIYPYEKRTEKGSIPCAVEVFPLRVEGELSDWPEAAERRRAWLAPAEAANRVDEPGLKAILLGFAAGEALRRGQ